jgi:hypothetical protein
MSGFSLAAAACARTQYATQRAFQLVSSSAAAAAAAVAVAAVALAAAAAAAAAAVVTAAAAVVTAVALLGALLLAAVGVLIALLLLGSIRANSSASVTPSRSRAGTVSRAKWFCRSACLKGAAFAQRVLAAVSAWQHLTAVN